MRIERAGPPRRASGAVQKQHERRRAEGGFAHACRRQKQWRTVALRDERTIRPSRVKPDFDAPCSRRKRHRRAVAGGCEGSGLCDERVETHSRGTQCERLAGTEQRDGGAERARRDCRGEQYLEQRRAALTHAGGSARPLNTLSMKKRARKKRALKKRAVRMGVVAIGAFALGAFAIGAVAIGALVIGRLRVRQARIAHLHIDELTVNRINLPPREPLI